MARPVSDDLPLVRELKPCPDSVDVFRRLVQRPRCLFLDSALRHATLGRYSFIVADPYLHMESRTSERLMLNRIESHVAAHRCETVPGLPPFQGGAAGLFSYDLCGAFERIPKSKFNEFDTPTLAVGLYDVVVAFDHVQQRAWIISQGFPETEPAARRQRAAERLAQCEAWLTLDLDGSEPPASIVAANEQKGMSYFRNGDATVEPSALAPQFPVNGYEHVTSNFSRDDYLASVQRVIDYIHAGDAFQVNLSQRLLTQATADSCSLYLRLRQRNPATFAGYYDLGDFQIVSASPERFVQVRDGGVEARPIKGTRQRTARPEADLYAADDLRLSEKDRAENVMIVDLLRNDMSRVCEPDSVQVTQLCDLEVYEYVHHLVSSIRGELQEDNTAIDLLKAAFPGGSITGAPKVRAMEIIAELEPTARGPYCGSLGYIGFDGSMDLSILIRTITAGRGWWQMPVGGGIVAQSNPQQEYEETWHKAAGMLKALS